MFQINLLVWEVDILNMINCCLQKNEKVIKLGWMFSTGDRIEQKSSLRGLKLVIKGYIQQFGMNSVFKVFS